MPLNSETRYCAVLGHPIRHSASPAMQNAAIASLGLNWRYLALDVKPEDLGSAIDGARVMGFIGLNLTIPHKLLAVKMVDVLDHSAQTWGAVNTIRFEGLDRHGKWLPLREFGAAHPGEVRSVGFNTDADGLERSLREDLNLELRGAKVILLGAGGAGRSAALKLATDGASEIFIVNRTPEKADALVDEIRKRFPKVKAESGYPHDHGATVDLLLNATSLGLNADDAMPLDEKQFSPCRAKAVYDMVYRPAETKFLSVAKAAGCRVANGVGMLLHQGALAMQIWTGTNPPVEIMRGALLKNIYGK